MARRKYKRVLILSDLHCGHEVGLTPARWNPQTAADAMSEYRQYMWSTFSSEVHKLKPIDILIGNGDLVDGRGEKSGSLELIVLDRLLQAKMAAEVLRSVGAAKTYIARGTDYHSGPEESWEELVAEDLGAARIGDILNIDINGLMVNARHHIGGSQTPLGRTTPLQREAAWNALWNVRQGFPLADILVRSHVHYHTYAGGPNWLAMTTPGLQGYGTRYGERRLSGLIDWGFVVLDVTSKEDFQWKAITFPFPRPPAEIA